MFDTIKVLTILTILTVVWLSFGILGVSAMLAKHLTVIQKVKIVPDEADFEDFVYDQVQGSVGGFILFIQALFYTNYFKYGFVMPGSDEHRESVGLPIKESK